MSENVDIEGLSNYEKLSSLPEDILRIRRRSRYDKVIDDAKNTPVKLTFQNEKRATSVCFALRSRIKKDKEKLEVRKAGTDVYVFSPRLLKTATSRSAD